MRCSFRYENLNSSAACGIVSNPTYAHGAIANVARIADNTPFVPTWANSLIFAVVAFAAIAAALSKPHKGCILMPFAFAEIKAEINKVNAQIASVAARTV